MCGSQTGMKAVLYVVWEASGRQWVNDSQTKDAMQIDNVPKLQYRMFQVR